MIGRRPDSVAFVLWSGEYGGAETWTLRLARAFAAAGVRTGLIFICSGGAIAKAAEGSGIPCRTLNRRRGREVLLSPRTLAEAVREVSAEAVVVPSLGFLCRALRLGGFRGVIVGVEHGALLQLEGMSPTRRLIRRLDLAGGSGAVDVRVAPSDYMVSRLRDLGVQAPLVRIHPGIDVPPEAPSRKFAQDRVRIGFVGRLIPGKGVDVLLEALARLRSFAWSLRIGGDGPQRAHLERMAAGSGIRDRVAFEGWIDNVGEFWKECDLAVVPSSNWIESFGIVALEAMAASLPVVASRQGGLPEIVEHGRSGALFESGNAAHLEEVLRGYLLDPSRLEAEGARGHRRCRTQFDISVSARSFHSAIGSALA